MINIITVESNAEFIKKFDKWIFLNSKEAVEDEFRKIVEWHSTAFKDEMSIKMMKEIDNAVRVGAYGVRTPIGKSCITCLSSGCKLGLLLWYYKDIDIPILTNLSRAGNNVWQFIAENFDVSFYTEEYDFYRLCDFNIDITIDGVLYKKEEKNFSALFDLYLRKEDEPYKITKERELDAYNRFSSGIQHDMYRDLKEEMTLKEFISSIDPKFDRDEYDFDYRVVNYCSVIPNSFTYRKHPIWFVGVKDSKYEFFIDLSVKYPSFLELFVDDIIYGYDWEDGEQVYLSQSYDKYFALVINDEERCIIREYPSNALFGVLVNAKSKTVELYDSRQAVHKFHEFYIKTEE